jgi:hypothetical protein
MDFKDKRSTAERGTGMHAVDDEAQQISGSDVSVGGPEFSEGLSQEFRALYDLDDGVRAEWDHTLGSGVSGNWSLSNATNQSAMIGFRLAAARGARARGCDPGLDPLIAWLEALRQSEYFHYGSEFVEQSKDGREHVRHIRGWIASLYLASAHFVADEANKVRWLLMRRAAEDLTLASPQAAKESTESFGQQLDQLRKECGLTIEKLAEKVHFDVRTVQRHCSEECVPTEENFFRYKRYFSRKLKRNVVLRRDAVKMP